MRILVLPKYDRLGASSRMRMYQFFPALVQAGFQIECAPLFDEGYLHALQRQRRSWFRVLVALLRRIAVLLKVRRYDLVWIEKECLPWVPYDLEHFFLRRSKAYVLDYDDAVFHLYDEHRMAWVRTLLGNKHPQLVQRAAAVIVGNAYLMQFALEAKAKAAGAKNSARSASHATILRLVPSVIDLNHYGDSIRPFDPSPSRGPAQVVWIGQRSTLKYLKPLRPLMLRLVGEGLCEFICIGADPSTFDLPMQHRLWHEASEVDELKRCDIGIMPLEDGAFERGKCGYKLIQYMASGLPVVASPVGANCHIVIENETGYFAQTLEQWEAALRALCQAAAKRREMGAAGQARAAKRFSLQALAGDVVQTLQRAAF